MRRLGLLLLFGTMISPLALTQQAFTYIDLANRLTDLEHLATLPPPGETTKQWSSYDRASKYDEATGKYMRWDANGDGGGKIGRSRLASFPQTLRTPKVPSNFSSPKISLHEHPRFWRNAGLFFWLRGRPFVIFCAGLSATRPPRRSFLRASYRFSVRLAY